MMGRPETEMMGDWNTWSHDLESFIGFKGFFLHFWVGLTLGFVFFPSIFGWSLTLGCSSTPTC